jgi:hypothetical protein
MGGSYEDVQNTNIVGLNAGVIRTGKEISRAATPGAGAVGSLGIVPSYADSVWVVIESGWVYIAIGENPVVPSGVDESAQGAGVKLPAGGVLWPVAAGAELKCLPTTNVTVEVTFLGDNP